MVLYVDKPTTSMLCLGRKGENKVTSFTFNIQAWVQEFGQGYATLYVKRFGDQEPYPAIIEEVEGNYVWEVLNSDVDKVGKGYIQLNYIVGEQVKKSIIYNTFVLPSLTTTSEEPPSPYQNWLDQMVEAEQQSEFYAGESERYSELSKGYSEAAAESAQQASQVFSFVDTGDGNIVITRSVGNG